MSKIINPMRRKVGRIELDIYDNNDTVMTAMQYGPLGQQVPMSPYDAACIMIQFAGGTLVEIKNAVMQQQKGNATNGQSDQTGPAQ